MKKQLILFMVLLVALLIGCSNQGNDSNVDNEVMASETTVLPTSTPTPTPLPTPTPTPIPVLQKSVKYEVIGSDRLKVEENEYEDGLLVHTVSYGLNSTSETMMEYHDNGNVKKDIYDSDSPTYHYHMEWAYTENEVLEYYLSESSGDGWTSKYELLPIYKDNILVGLEGSSVSNYGYGDTIYKVTSDYVYDENGRLIQEIEYWDGSRSDTVYTYDDEGRRISIASDSSSTSYTYSEGGRLIAEVYEYEEFISLYHTRYMTKTTKYEYDEEGLLLKQTEKYESYLDGISYDNVYSYEYDECGNVEKCIFETTENGFEESTTYIYENEYA